MKIYCSRHDGDNSLDRFIGADVWVRVIVPSYDGHTKYPYFFRVISKDKSDDGEDMYWVNHIYDSNGGEPSPYAMSSDDIEQTLSSQWAYLASDITVAHPLEIYNTDEFLRCREDTL